MAHCKLRMHTRGSQPSQFWSYLPDSSRFTSARSPFRKHKCAPLDAQMLVCKVAKRVGSSRVRSLHPPLPPREPQRASHYLLCGFAIKSLHSCHGESNSDCSRAHFVSNMPYNCGHSWQMMISLFLCMQGNAGLSSSLAVSRLLCLTSSSKVALGAQVSLQPRIGRRPPAVTNPSKIVKLRTACPSRSRTAATERLPPSHNLTHSGVR